MVLKYLATFSFSLASVSPSVDPFYLTTFKIFMSSDHLHENSALSLSESDAAIGDELLLLPDASDFLMVDGLDGILGPAESAAAHAPSPEDCSSQTPAVGVPADVPAGQMGNRDEDISVAGTHEQATWLSPPCTNYFPRTLDSILLTSPSANSFSHVACRTQAGAALPAPEEISGTVRVAFKVRTELDGLDDGFKWRKYGKKAVKGNPNMRNYYRCQARGCGVKKRVQRDRDDAACLVVTYEGTHAHPPVVAGSLPISSTAGSLIVKRLDQHQQYPWSRPDAETHHGLLAPFNVESP